MPVGSGRPRISRPTKDPDKPPNSIIKFGLLIQEIDVATEIIATLRKAGGLNAGCENELYKRVSQASISVRDSVPSFAISTFPVIQDALEEYNLILSDVHRGLNADPTNYVPLEDLLDQINCWVDKFQKNYVLPPGNPAIADDSSPLRELDDCLSTSTSQYQ
ncbi:hypothetical protein HYPSUDRAFT_685468 [Hypholoma sublateritium FD-334 SS-4]|uniref:Uncharacterized protein n=1 Tax=Hypholoma sublateritium (strain FD-334 SS-4) TaxID=945553 RepID=A0A0D2PP03_HYPSF|nr:hypothetical protein HYPSUDRAFT_685468 [Hypholoma sublateritium FD-334 SS-4]